MAENIHPAGTWPMVVVGRSDACLGLILGLLCAAPASAQVNLNPLSVASGACSSCSCRV